MAFFTKKTWVARQGTGLNKFSINGATPVTVVNQPDSVTEQGDALSATNLNNLEQRIYDAFDDVADDIHDVIEDIEDGTVVAKKAEQDANGNEITTTYETKADASELKSEIDNNSQRIENLEVAVSGSLVQTNTDATMANTKVITNANEILPWAILKRVGARAVNWNQLMPEKTTLTNNGITFSIDYANLKITMSGTATANARLYLIPDSLANGFKGINGHKYAVIWNLSDFAEGYASLINNGGLDFSVVSSTRPQGWIVTQTDNTKGSGFLIQVNNGETINKTIDYPTLHDLTTMGEYDSSLTDAQNLANFKAKFPSSYPYNTGTIYDLNPEGFLVRGVNLWDEEWEVGTYDASDGLPRNGGWYDDNCCRSKNYIPVSPNTTYQVKNFWVEFFDANKNYLHDYVQGYTTRTITFTTPTNCVYVLLTSASDYGNTYKYDTQFCFDSLPTSVKTVYHPYDGRTVDTPQIADGHYVNENCYDYVENVIENGAVKGKKHLVVGSITYDGSNDENWVDASGGKFYIQKNDLVKALDYKVKMICDKLEVATYHGTLTNMSITGYSDGSSLYPNQNWLYVQIDSSSITTVAQLRTWLASNPITIYYELATETITDVDPIPNIPCENGTSATAITPQTDLVNAIDVPSTIAYMTKIAS